MVLADRPALRASSPISMDARLSLDLPPHWNPYRRHREPATYQAGWDLDRADGAVGARLPERPVAGAAAGAGAGRPAGRDGAAGDRRRGRGGPLRDVRLTDLAGQRARSVRRTRDGPGAGMPDV